MIKKYILVVKLSMYFYIILIMQMISNDLEERFLKSVNIHELFSNKYE